MNTPSNSAAGLARDTRQAAGVQKLIKNHYETTSFITGARSLVRSPDVNKSQIIPILLNFDVFLLPDALAVN